MAEYQDKMSENIVLAESASKLRTHGINIPESATKDQIKRAIWDYKDMLLSEKLGIVEGDKNERSRLISHRLDAINRSEAGSGDKIFREVDLAVRTEFSDFLSL